MLLLKYPKKFFGDENKNYKFYTGNKGLNITNYYNHMPYFRL